MIVPTAHFRDLLAVALFVFAFNACADPDISPVDEAHRSARSW
jgi:hypothetical protein